MNNLVLLACVGLMLAGCQSLTSLTPSQQAAIFCVVTADGTAIAVASTKGGAQASALSAQNASVTACDLGTKVGQIVTPPVPPTK